MRNKKDLNNKDPHSWVQNGLVKLRAYTSGLFFFIFVMMGTLIGYYIFGGLLQNPFSRLDYSMPSYNELGVVVETRFPARTKLEYGTSTSYLNSVYINNTFETEHRGMVAGLLPEKSHIFRIVAQDENGRLFYSNFYSAP